MQRKCHADIFLFNRICDYGRRSRRRWRQYISKISAYLYTLKMYHSYSEGLTHSSLVMHEPWLSFDGLLPVQCQAITHSNATIKCTTNQNILFRQCIRIHRLWKLDHVVGCTMHYIINMLLTYEVNVPIIYKCKWYDNVLLTPKIRWVVCWCEGNPAVTTGIPS